VKNWVFQDFPIQGRTPKEHSTTLAQRNITEVRMKVIPKNLICCALLMMLAGSQTNLWGQTSDFVYAVYVANRGGNISAYLVNNATGALTEVTGSPFPAGLSPISIAAGPESPSGASIYVVNNQGRTLSTFATETSGVLRQISPQIPTGSSPVSVSVHPSGQFVYVANGGSDDVSAYVIDAEGFPQPMVGSPFPAGRNPASVVADPSGQFLYVANDIGASVSSYSIDPTTGALTPLPDSAFGIGRVETFAVSPTGLVAYAAHSGSEIISGWLIDPVTGALSPAGFSNVRSLTPVAVTVMLSPLTGASFVYVANESFGTVSAFNAGLVPVAGSPFRMQGRPRSVVSDPTGRFLYVANIGRGVSALTIDGITGALSEIAGSPFPAPGTIGLSITVVAVVVPVPVPPKQ
jgi:6-phosphogluconolactonase (cycloisomerase 2 family)